MKTVLVTGADGFVASHLIGEIGAETDWRILGLGLKEGPGREVPGMEYRVADLTDYELVREVLDLWRPEGIFHLAAQPSVALSWDDPWSTYRANLFGQLNLLEALRGLGLEASVHIACSSEEYGKVPPERMPLTEEMPFNPCSHYAVSKVGQEVLGLMYNRAFGWRVLVTRGFNQAGPGQAPDFVVSSFARQIACIEAGECEPVIMVGNLEARRDFTDVRDTVRAYRLVMEKGRAGASYNVCTGKARKVSELLEMMLGLSSAKVEVRSIEARQRPSDIPLLVGDSSLLRRETGWEPLMPLERTLADVLDYWRERVKASLPPRGGEGTTTEVERS